MDQKQFSVMRKVHEYLYITAKFARRQPLGLLGILLLLAFIVCALFAPWLSPFDPAHLDLEHRMLTPTAGHLFGTDELGRDILSRLLFGARISLIVAVSVVALSLSIGLSAGCMSGFYGGPLDIVLNVYVTNAFLALPGILLAIAFVAFLGPGLSISSLRSPSRAGSATHASSERR